MQSSAQPGLTPGGRAGTLLDTRHKAPGRLSGGGGSSPPAPRCRPWLPRVATHSVSARTPAGSVGPPLFWDALTFPERKILEPPGLSQPGWWHKGDEANPGCSTGNQEGTTTGSLPGWSAHPTQDPRVVLFPPTSLLQPLPCARAPWGWSTEQSNYLHPFFLMMFPNTTSALPRRPRHGDFITA